MLEGHKEKVSCGGKLIIDFLKSAKYVAVNSTKYAVGIYIYLFILLFHSYHLDQSICVPCQFWLQYRLTCSALVAASDDGFLACFCRSGWR